MPVIKAFVSASLLPLAPAAQQRLGDRTEAACIDILHAARPQIQLMVIPAQAVLRGEQVYLEINFRDTEFRSAEVVEQFMKSMEVGIVDAVSVLPRIRCFAENQSFLFARN